MKHSIIATTIALGLACACGVSTAQDAPQTANLQDVEVIAAPGQFEIYTINLSPDYGLKVLVGHTHRQYMQARRAAEGAEALRKQGRALSPSLSVALDNSSGPGMGRRILVSDSTQGAVAVVEVYCKHVVQASRKRCLLVSLHPSGQSLASKATEHLHVAVADLR